MRWYPVGLFLVALVGVAYADDATSPWEASSLDRAALTTAKSQAEALRATKASGENADAWKQAIDGRVAALDRLIERAGVAAALADEEDNHRRHHAAHDEQATLERVELERVVVEVARQEDLAPYEQRHAEATRAATEAANALRDALSIRERIGRRTTEVMDAEREEAVKAASPGDGELAAYRAVTGQVVVRTLDEEKALLAHPPKVWQAWIDALLVERDVTRTKAAHAQATLERARATVSAALKEAEADAVEAAQASERAAQEETDPIARFVKQIKHQRSQLKVLEVEEQQLTVTLDRRAAEAKNEISRLTHDQNRINARLALAGGPSDKIAGLLRRTLARLNHSRTLLRDEHRPWLYAALDRIQTARAEVQDQLWELDAPIEDSPLYRRLLKDLGDEASPNAPQAARDAYREAVSGPEGLITVLNRRLAALVRMDADLGALETGPEGYSAWRQQIEKLHSLVMRRIYWVRTDEPIGGDTLADAAGEGQRFAAFFADGSRWASVREAAAERPLRFWGLLAALIASVLVLLRYRNRAPGFIRRWLDQGGALWRGIKHTAAALVRSALAPVVLLFAAAWLRAADGGEGALSAIANAAQLFALAWFGWRFVRRFLAPGGVAVGKFGMPLAMAAQLRRSATLCLAALLLFYLPRATLSAPPFRFHALPRLLHPLFLATTFAGIWLLLPRKQPVARAWVGTRGFWYGAWGLVVPIAAVVFAGIIAMDVLGYRIGADGLTTNLIQTLVAGLVLSALYFVLRHVTQAAAERVLRQQSLEGESRRAARETSQTVLNQLTRLTSVGLLVATVIALARFWDLDEALRSTLQPIELAHVSEGVVLTMWDVFRAVVVVVLAHFVVRNLGGLLEFVVFPLVGTTDTGTRYVLSTLARYAILVVAWSAAFLMLHFSFSSIGWLLAAASVGIGFGLQEIVANFVSGIIVLLERPVRVGDVVTIGTTWGTVEQIQARATHVVNRDHMTVVIPNKNLITQEVINWTRNDRAVRRILPVGVTYGADIQKVIRALTEVASAHPHVLKQPAPKVIFAAFGASSLDLEIRFFADAVDGVNVRSDLHEQVLERFRKDGIEIPFPQRDLHLKTGSLELKEPRSEEYGAK